MGICKKKQSFRSHEGTNALSFRIHAQMGMKNASSLEKECILLT